MQPELDEKIFGMVTPRRVGDFYSAYHRYLKDSGIDGVKVRISAEHVVLSTLEVRSSRALRSALESP